MNKFIKIISLVTAFVFTAVAIYGERHQKL